jgi:hypothetical protein
MNPVDEFLKIAFDKVAISEEMFGRAMERAQEQAEGMRGKGIPLKQRFARLNRLREAYMRRMRSRAKSRTPKEQRRAAAFEQRTKQRMRGKPPLKEPPVHAPGGKEYTFGKTQKQVKQRQKARVRETKARHRQQVLERRKPPGARLTARDISPRAEADARARGKTLGQMHAERKLEAERQVRGKRMEGRGALRQARRAKAEAWAKRRAAAAPPRSGSPGVGPEGPGQWTRPETKKPMPSGAPSKPTSAAAAAGKSAKQVAKKGLKWGRVGKAVGAAGLAAGLGYGAYRLLKGRGKGKEKAAMVSGFFDEFYKIRGS